MAIRHRPSGIYRNPDGTYFVQSINGGPSPTDPYADPAPVYPTAPLEPAPPDYGGGGGYSPPAPPPQLDSDASWLAFSSELDRENQMYGAEAQRRSGNATAMRDRLLADLIPRGEQERTDISGGMEARGLFGGGQFEEKIARQRSNEGQRSTHISADAAQQVSDIEGQLAMQQAEIERRRAEARADYLSRGYV